MNSNNDQQQSSNKLANEQDNQTSTSKNKVFLISGLIFSFALTIAAIIFVSIAFFNNTIITDGLIFIIATFSTLLTGFFSLSISYIFRKRFK